MNSGDASRPYPVAEHVVYRNEFIAVFDDEVGFPDGRQGRYVRIVEADGKPGVAILALCNDSVALVRTFRYPIDRWDWGIPRGFAHGDNPVVSAEIELREELGAEPQELSRLGVLAPNSGLLASTVTLFVARYNEPVSSPTDVAEIQAVKWIPVDQLLVDIAAGDIIDGFTIAAVGLATAHKILAGFSGE